MANGCSCKKSSPVAYEALLDGACQPKREVGAVAVAYCSSRFKPESSGNRRSLKKVIPLLCFLLAIYVMGKGTNFYFSLEANLKKILSATFFALLVQGCSYQKTNIINEAEKEKYSPYFSSRIRAFNSPETTGSFKTLENCKDASQAKNGKDVESRIFRDRSSTKTYILWRRVDLLGMKEEDYVNRVIGIPATLTTESLKSERLGYDEFVVPAGKPTVLIMSYNASSDSGRSWCYPKPAYLTPKAGKDYEVKLEFEKIDFLSSGCRVVISEITGANMIKQPQEISSNSCVSD